MLLEIIIGASVVSSCITAISIYGMSLAKKYQEGDAILDREELAIYKADKEKEESEKKKNLPSREDLIPFMPSLVGELSQCPFCTWTHPKGTRIPTGYICKKYLDENNTMGLRSHDWHEKDITGPSSGVGIITKDGPRLYQCCARCYGEWLTMPKGFFKEDPAKEESPKEESSKEESPKVEPPPLPKKSRKLKSTIY